MQTVTKTIKPSRETTRRAISTRDLDALIATLFESLSNSFLAEIWGEIPFAQQERIATTWRRIIRTHFNIMMRQPPEERRKAAGRVAQQMTVDIQRRGGLSFVWATASERDRALICATWQSQIAQTFMQILITGSSIPAEDDADDASRDVA